MPPGAHELQPTSSLPPASGGLRIQPSIGVQEYFTDNVFQTPTHKSSDFVTGITPGLSVRDDTARIQAAAEYNPTGLIYARNPSQDSINQNFAGQATVTLVPETLFLDARGYVTTTATNGGFAPGSAPLLSRNQRSTVTSFTVSPYAVHRFGDIGTGEIGVTLGTTSFSGGQNNGFTGFNSFGAPIQNNPNGDTQSLEETAQFTTGAILPRLQDRTLFDASQQTGNVGTQRSTQFLATNRAEDALNRQIALIGELGYENLRFEGIPPVRISDMVGAWPLESEPGQQHHRHLRPSERLQLGVRQRTLCADRAYHALRNLFDRIADRPAADPEQPRSRRNDPYGNSCTARRWRRFREQQPDRADQQPQSRADVDRECRHHPRPRHGHAVRLPSGADTACRCHGGPDRAERRRYQRRCHLDARALGPEQRQPACRLRNVLRDRLVYRRRRAEHNQFDFDVTATLSHVFTPSLSGVAQYVYTHRTSNIVGQGFVQNLFLVGVQKTF